MGYWIWSPLLPGGAALPGTHTVYVTDTIAVQTGMEAWRKLQRTYVDLSAVDQTQWHVFDELPIHLTPEGAITPTPFSVTDTCVVVASDATPLITSTVSANDTVKLGILTELPAILVTLTVTDSCAIQASELAAVLNAFSTVDTCAIQASEASPTVVAVLSVNDSCAIQASEVSVLINSAVGATDSNVVQASEGSVLVNSTVSMADSAGITASDLVAILATGTVTDGLLVQLTEAVSILAATVASDTCAVIISEATPNVIQLTILSVTDSCAVIASESTPIIGQAFLVTDALAVIASDVNVGPHAVTAQDSLAIQSTEATTNSLPTVASDSVILGATDPQPLISQVTSVADAIAVQISDVGSQSVVGAATPISASDSCSLGLDDQIVQPHEVAVGDTIALPIDERIGALAVPAEEVALHLLEEVRLEITMLETIWGGGSPFEEARDLYAYSYRMGRRNPDETRGTEY